MKDPFFFSAKTNEEATPAFLEAHPRWLSALKAFEGSLEQHTSGLISLLEFYFVLSPRGASDPFHKNQSSYRPSEATAHLQRHLDYPRFMDATPQERLALMAQTFLDGILELPKARGLKQLDAKALHDALRKTLEAEGLLDSVENI